MAINKFHRLASLAMSLDPSSRISRGSAVYPFSSPSLPILIIGGGFSGSMLAARLAERGQACVLIEKSGHFGPGVAYSATLDTHRLNVRSERMGAVAGHVDGFVNWLKSHHPDHADPNGFAPRRLYGLYVQDRLTQCMDLYPGRIEQVTGEAMALDDTGSAPCVTLADGRQIKGRIVVLATGNPAPRTAPASDNPRVIADPWAPQALDRIKADDSLIILGTGLTMVDIVLGLKARGWQGQASLVSRRGQWPRPHGPHHDPALDLPLAALTGPLSQRLKTARKLARQHGWRSVMEGYRGITISLWRQASMEERTRFLRHLRPWWDVHRHRIAPDIAQTLEDMRQQGQLTPRTGRVQQVSTDDQGVCLNLIHADTPIDTLRADWLIDCTGPGHDPLRHPLTADLIHQGTARLDPIKLGLDLDEDGHILNSQGQPNPRILVLGPPARAALWETIAVPDIRNRIEAMSDLITA